MTKNFKKPLFLWLFFLISWIPYLFFVYQWFETGNVFYQVFWWIFLIPALFDPYFYLVLFGILLFTLTRMSAESVGKVLD